MKDNLQKNVSYKKIGLVFLVLALVIFIGSTSLNHTPATPDETATTQNFYTNKAKTFTVQFPSLSTITESPDGSVYGDIDSPHKARIMISTFGNSENIPKDKWIPANDTIQNVTTLEDKTSKLIDVYQDQFKAKPSVVRSEISSVSGVPAYLVELGNDEVKVRTLSYSLLKDGHFFEIAIIYSSDDEDYIVPVFNNFIDSFKVL